jgi:hypothetical protein
MPTNYVRKVVNQSVITNMAKVQNLEIIRRIWRMQNLYLSNKFFQKKKMSDYNCIL